MKLRAKNLFFKNLKCPLNPFKEDCHPRLILASSLLDPMMVPWWRKISIFEHSKTAQKQPKFRPKKACSIASKIAVNPNQNHPHLKKSLSQRSLSKRTLRRLYNFFDQRFIMKITVVQSLLVSAESLKEEPASPLQFLWSTVYPETTVVQSLHKLRSIPIKIIPI